MPKHLIYRKWHLLPPLFLPVSSPESSSLKYSVNTWDQGFVHKLSKSTNPVGVVSELILAVLNVNVKLPSLGDPHS